MVGYRLDTIKTLNYILKHLKNTEDCIEKIYLEDRYNDIFKKFLNDFKNYMNPNKPNQFAFIIFIKKDGTLDTKYPEVYFPNGKKKKHNEDYIFDILKEILDKNDCPYTEALIFSTNSLCFERKNCKSCMSQAIDLAEKLYKKHKMKLIIGFYKPWGINGSYASILPYKPLKDCTYTFESKTLGSNDISHKKTTNKIDKESLKLLEELIYNTNILDVQNKTFLMEGNKTKDNQIEDNLTEENIFEDNRIEDNLTEENKTKDNKPKSNRTKDDIPKAEYNLDTFYSITCDLKNKEKLDQIASSLFEHEKLIKTFDDFKNHGTEMFDTCMNEIKVELMENDAHLYEEIRSSLQNVFFPWWAKKVENASSRFLNEEISCFLQEIAVYYTLKNTRDIEHFVIGYVNFIWKM